MSIDVYFIHVVRKRTSPARTINIRPHVKQHHEYVRRDDDRAKPRERPFSGNPDPASSLMSEITGLSSKLRRNSESRRPMPAGDGVEASEFGVVGLLIGTTGLALLVAVRESFVRAAGDELLPRPPGDELPPRPVMALIEVSIIGKVCRLASSSCGGGLCDGVDGLPFLLGVDGLQVVDPAWLPAWLPARLPGSPLPLPRRAHRDDRDGGRLNSSPNDLLFCRTIPRDTGFAEEACAPVSSANARVFASASSNTG